MVRQVASLANVRMTVCQWQLLSAECCRCVLIQYVVWYMIPYTDNSIDFRTATSLKVDNFVCYFVSCNMGIVQHSLSRQCFNWHVLFGVKALLTVYNLKKFPYSLWTSTLIKNTNFVKMVPGQPWNVLKQAVAQLLITSPCGITSINHFTLHKAFLM